jgi:hypothetical protein
MRSPINLYHVTTLEEPSQWAPEPICEPDYRALGDVILGFDDALAEAILLSDRYEAKVTIPAACSLLPASFPAPDEAQAGPKPSAPPASRRGANCTTRKGDFHESIEEMRFASVDHLGRF